MSNTLPPIYRDCRRLLVHTEEVVRLAAYFELVSDGGLQVRMPARWLVRRRKALAKYLV